MPPAAAGQPAAGKKHRKKPRRGGIGGQSIRRPSKPVPADRRPLAERRAAFKAAGGVTNKKFVKGPRRIHTKAVERLPQLWLNTYEIPVMLELAENDFLGVTAGAQLLQNIAPKSTYQTHGRVSAEQGERRVIKDELMRIKWAAAARHRANQLDCPFSMLARSIGKLARADSGKTWVEDSSILSKVRSKHFLDALVPLRPPPSFKVATCVSAYAWDQYYMKEHCNGKEGEYRGRKSVSTTGMTHTWRKVTNINTVEERRAVEPTHPHARAPASTCVLCCCCADRAARHRIHAYRGGAQGDHRARAVHGAAVGRVPPLAAAARAPRDRPQLAARGPPLARRIHRPPHTAGEKDFAALAGLLL